MLMRDICCRGLPPWHQYVIEQGHPPEEAEAAIKNSTRLMVERGYNVKSEHWHANFQ